MVRAFRGIIAGCVLSLFLALVIRAYLGDARQIAGLDYYPPPVGPYPAQYLPALFNVPAPTPTPPPLHVGLQLAWEGGGHIYIDGYHWSPGTHMRREVDQQVDGDTVRTSNRRWYSPNPFNWPSESWYCHVNTISQLVESCSTQDDPDWKWGHPWIMPVSWRPVSGGTIKIEGKVFTVTGPHSFVSGYGETAYFWRMTNRDRFLVYDSGGEWTQYVEPGDAVLFFDYTGSGILLYDNIKRTYYRNDNPTADYVRYESLLSQFDGRALVNSLTDFDAVLRSTATQGDDAVTLAAAPDLMRTHIAGRGITFESLLSH